MDGPQDSTSFALPPWTNRTLVEIVFALVAGFALAITVQRILGWWLDSAEGVAATILVSFFAPLVIFRKWYTALAFWAAMMNGMTVILFEIGPGTIFPIVLGIGGVITGGAVFAGWIVTWGLGQVWARTRERLIKGRK